MKQKLVLFLYFFSFLYVYGQTEENGNTTRFGKPEIKIISLTLENLYQIDEGVYRSEQPDEDAFRLLEEYGISEVLNLRSFHNDKDETEGTDLILHRVTMNAHYITDEDVVDALSIIANRKGNILIHCKHGSDRTGVVCAMYRIVFQGWTKEDAIDELKNGGYGYHNLFFNIPAYIESVDIEEIKEKLAAGMDGKV